MKPTLLILAAGIGSRYGGLKQVDGMGPDGEAILEYSIFDALRAGFGKVVFVIRKDIEAAFREKVGDKVAQHIPTAYAFQEMNTGLEWLDTLPPREKPWGTAHAILSAKAVLDTPFAAINADDYYGADAFAKLGEFLRRDCTPDTFGMVAYRLANTLSENGAVSRGVCTVSSEGYLTDVVERTKIERFNGAIHFLDDTNEKHDLAEDTPVSMNFWGFHHAILPRIEVLFRDFVQQNMGKPRAEFYIPTVVNHQINGGHAHVKVLRCSSQWYGVTYPEDKGTVQQALRQFAAGQAYPAPLWS
jgi:hypothetical protein